MKNKIFIIVAFVLLLYTDSNGQSAITNNKELYIQSHTENAELLKKSLEENLASDLKEANDLKDRMEKIIATDLKEAYPFIDSIQNGLEPEGLRHYKRKEFFLQKEGKNIKIYTTLKKYEERNMSQDSLIKKDGDFFRIKLSSDGEIENYSKQEQNKIIDISFFDCNNFIKEEKERKKNFFSSHYYPIGFTKNEKEKGSSFGRNSNFYPNGKLRQTREAEYRGNDDFTMDKTVGFMYSYDENGVIIGISGYEYDDSLFIFTEEDVITYLKMVNVVLFTADSVFIEGTTTDKSGNFILQKGSETLNRLTFTYTGYQTKTINVTHGNVGEIIILSDTLALIESVVIGSNTIFKDGKRIITPTTEQLEKSPTGFILLDNLDLPRLNVDIVQNSISVMGGGNVVLLINGREADRNEITGLDPQNIINVEYSDMPTARFADASIIVNFVVKQAEKGGMFLADLTNGLSMIYGEDVFYTKFYNGASQFSIWYMPQFRDLKSQWRENEETFNLAGGTVKREEIGEPARFRYLFNNLNFRYNYYKNDRMFDVSLSNEITNQPDNNFKSKLFTNTGIDTLFMTDNSRNKAFTPRLRLYYQEPLGENQKLFASLSGGYAKRNYKRDYREMLNDNNMENYFYSDVDEKQQTYNASITYENLMDLGKSGWKLRFTSALKHNYIKSENIYNNQISKISSEINVNRSELSVSSIFLKNRSVLYGHVSLYRNNHSLENINVTDYILYVAITGKHTFTKKSSIVSDFMISYNQNPSLSDLSDVDQFIDSIQIRRGNPNLTNPKFYQGTLRYEFEIPKLYIYVQTKYSYTAKPVMETSFLENNYIIRTVENHKSLRAFSSYFLLNTSGLWNFLSFRLWAEMTRTFSYGNTYTHTNNIFSLSGRVNIKYKKWQLIYEIWGNSSDYFWGETLEKSYKTDKITLYYVTPKFYIGVGCFNPVFAEPRMKATINYSAVAPYNRVEYMDTFKRGKGIFIKFIKTFKWGQQKDDIDINASDEKTESAILKGQK